MLNLLDYFQCPEFQIIDCSGFHWLFRPDDLVGEMLSHNEALAVANARLMR